MGRASPEMRGPLGLGMVRSQGEWVVWGSIRLGFAFNLEDGILDWGQCLG